MVRLRARGKFNPSQADYWIRHMAHGWTSERRAKQSAAIRQWRPWERSTGPRTAAGKARVARNAYKGGGQKEALRTLARLLRELRREAR